MKEPTRVALGTTNFLIVSSTTRLLLRDIPGPHGIPLASTPWTLLLDGRELESGKADSEGAVEPESPLEASGDYVLRYRGQEVQLYVLQTSGLELVHTLESLGYGVHGVDTDGDIQTAEAISEFQRDNDLAPTGTLDEATAARLEERSQELV